MSPERDESMEHADAALAMVNRTSTGDCRRVEVAAFMGAVLGASKLRIREVMAAVVCPCRRCT